MLRTSYRSEASRSSSYPRAALAWSGKVEEADFDVLDSKIASGLRKLFHETSSQVKSILKKEKAETEKRFLTGGQNA